MTRFGRPGQVAAWVAAALAVAGLAGCRRAGSADGQQAAASQPAEKPFQAPKPPGGEDGLAVRASVMVTTRPSAEEPAYTQDEALPRGGLKGLCYIPAKAFPSEPKAPDPQPWAFTGPGAIPNPLPGEVEYYKGCRITQPAHWHVGARQISGYGVVGGAVWLRGVKAGPKEPLSRPGFTAGQGQFTCQVIDGYGLSHIGFVPRGERVLFGSVDAYPCQFVLTEAATGNAVFEGTADPYEKLQDPTERDEARGGRPDPRAFRPKILQSPPASALGLHRITCRRHPWQEAWLFVVENPYVAEVGSRGRDAGLFGISAVPVGRHELEVWHPRYQPVKKLIEVVIEKNKTTEVLVEFRSPEQEPIRKTAGESHNAIWVSPGWGVRE